MDASSAAKLAFMLRPESYPDGTESVEVIETHFAWVFLSRRFAYKLKKPIRSLGFDLTSPAARRANCELEVALNRRLAESVYVGVVPLVRGATGFHLEAAGEPEDWLVKMHRLPRERMLDRAAAAGTVTETDLVQFVEKLAGFYARTPRTPWSAAEYREHLARSIERYTHDLAAPDLKLDLQRVRALAASQLRFVRKRAALLDARVAAGRVVDAHGDLRPEHVFLGDPPQIIDCLEFSAELRLLDTAEEIAFLSLECERLGFGTIGARVEELYRRACADDAPPDLLGFYKSARASVRAWLAALRLRDNLPDDVRAMHRRRAQWYLDIAQAAVASGARSRKSAA